MQKDRVMGYDYDDNKNNFLNSVKSMRRALKYSYTS